VLARALVLVQAGAFVADRVPSSSAWTSAALCPRLTPDLGRSVSPSSRKAKA